MKYNKGYLLLFNAHNEKDYVMPTGKLFREKVDFFSLS